MAENVKAKSAPSPTAPSQSCEACRHTWTGSSAACPECACEVIRGQASAGQASDRLAAARKTAADNGINIAFALAVEDHRMSVAQARAKGNRDAVARRIAERHALSLKLAYQVADGKLPVREAMRAARARSAPARRVERVPLLWFGLAGAALIVAAIMGVSMGSGPEPDVAATPIADPPGLAGSSSPVGQVKKNPQDQMTFVMADTPERVLDLYCGQGSGRRARNIVKTDARRAQGLFVDESNLHDYVISITFDPVLHSWVAGDSKSFTPVFVKPAR